MARIRTIKPSFFRHTALFDAERACGLPLRIAFAGLWTCADREGRFHWRPRELKLDCLPFDDVDFGNVLNALEQYGFIVRFTVKGEQYGHIPSWERHQHVNAREPASTIPSPDQADTEQVPVRAAHVHARVEGKGREEERKGMERERVRGTRLPPDWHPSDALLTWTQDECPALDVSIEAAKFRDYWHARAGPGGVKLDWDATWRNWARRADGDGRRGTNGRDSANELAERRHRAAERGLEIGSPIRADG